MSNTPERSKAGPAAAISIADSRPLAPATMTISFWPLESTTIAATPLAASGVVEMNEVSTPSARKFAKDASPRLSSPSFATIVTDEPSSAAATA